MLDKVGGMLYGFYEQLCLEISDTTVHILAAGIAGMRIEVASIVVSNSGAASHTFRSSADTLMKLACTAVLPVVLSANRSELPVFETSEGEDLTFQVSTGTAYLYIQYRYCIA